MTNVIDRVTTTTVTIDRTISGLRGIAFGGYVAGLLATRLTPSTKVIFHKPVPLGVPLRIESGPGPVALCRDNEALVSAEPTTISLDLPPLPPVDEPELASADFVSEGSPVPTCFGCGSGRIPGDGLRIFAGAIASRRVVATIWSPHEAFGDEGGLLRPEFLWAALDCPGGLARRNFQAAGKPGVTAFLEATTSVPPFIGEPTLVLGWPIQREGRKSWVGSAVLNATGNPCAVARALWIDVRET